MTSRVRPASMTPEISTLLAVVAVGLLLLAGGVYWWINRTPHVERNENEPLPLFGSMQQDEWQSSAAARPAARSTPPSAPAVRSTPPSAPAVRAMPAPPPEASPRSGPVIREFVTRGTPPASPAVTPLVTPRPSPTPIPTPISAAIPASPAPAEVNHTVVSESGVPGTMVEGHALRFSVPAEGTLQFLPGRLEIGSGLDSGREIRFVRVEGPNGIEVTFGRSEGELYRHVQLRDKTVSRAHAVMRFHDAVWSLRNLSLTNPVVHNGVQMAGNAVQPLSDGDRVEMGEVLFTFRSR